MARLESRSQKVAIVSLVWFGVVISLIVAGLGVLGIKDETISIREKEIEEALVEIADLRRERDRLKKSLEDPATSVIDRAIAAAVHLQRQGKTEEAIEKWRAIATVAGEENRRLQARAWFSIGSLLGEGEGADWEAVLDVYTKAIELNPTDAKAYNNRGVAKDSLGQYDAAIADYDRAIELNPTDAKAYYNRGNAKDELGQYDAAIADHDRAIELNPTYDAAYNNRGNAKYELGQYDAAMADYDRAIELNPVHAAAYNNRGAAKDELGQYDAAIADYDRAIELNPTDAKAYNNRGNAKDELGQYDAAIADYDRAIELNPTYAAAYYNRGNAKDGLDRRNEAREDFETALALAQEAGNENVVARAKRNLRLLDNSEAPRPQDQ